MYINPSTVASNSANLIQVISKPSYLKVKSIDIIDVYTISNNLKKTNYLSKIDKITKNNTNEIKLVINFLDLKVGSKIYIKIRYKSTSLILDFPYFSNLYSLDENFYLSYVSFYIKSKNPLYFYINDPENHFNINQDLRKKVFKQKNYI